jgi:hypothetical protein
MPPNALPRRRDRWPAQGGLRSFRAAIAGTEYAGRAAAAAGWTWSAAKFCIFSTAPLRATWAGWIHIAQAYA